MAGPLTSVAVAALLSLPAGSRADVPASPSPAPRPSTSATLSTVKPMSDDMRVKAEDIDSVMQDQKVFFLDVRDPKELEESGSYEGYVNIPMSQLESRLAEIPKDRPILTACQGGGRAARAAALLEKNGYKITGFCGLKDYKGNRVKPVGKAPQ